MTRPPRYLLEPIEQEITELLEDNPTATKADIEDAQAALEEMAMNWLRKKWYIRILWEKWTEMRKTTIIH